MAKIILALYLRLFLIEKNCLIIIKIYYFVSKEEQKLIHVNKNKVIEIYIGKEANSIEDQPLDVTGAQVFINEDEITKKILALTPEEARKLGIKHEAP